MPRTKTLFLVFLSVSIIISSPLFSSAKISFEPICGANPETIARNIAKRDFPNLNTYFSFPVAGNDILCDSPENMLNMAVIITEDPRKKYHFGIFHIHFAETGEIMSAAPILSWIIITNLDDPIINANWCEFIKSVYPKELKEQGCKP